MAARELNQLLGLNVFTEADWTGHLFLCREKNTPQQRGSWGRITANWGVVSFYLSFSHKLGATGLKQGLKHKQREREGASPPSTTMLSKRSKRRCMLQAVRMDDGGEDEDDSTSVTRRGTALYFNADVNKKSVRELSEQLDEAVKDAWQGWNRVDAPRVSLWIHSGGGDLYSGLQAFNVIKRCVLPVVTVGEGIVASAATLLHLAGSARHITPGTHMLIHQLRSSADGTHSELRDEVENNTKLMDQLEGIYLTHTGLRKKKLKKLFKRELELTATDCVAMGIASSILVKPPTFLKETPK